MNFERRSAEYPDSAAELLVEAADAITQRAEQRDQPDGERSMRRAIAAFNAIYETSLTEVQGWQFMALLKIARAAGGKNHRDDFIDQAAYAALAGECASGGLLSAAVNRALRPL